MNSSLLLGRLVQGAGWLSMARAVSSALDLATKLLLAWMLTPEDFGIVGLALLVVMLAQKLSESGFSAALIQRDQLNDQYLDAGWTIQVGRGVILFWILFLTAPYLVSFVDAEANENTVLIIRIFAAVQMIEALSNIGLVKLDRDMDFRPVALYQLSISIVKSFFALCFAFVFRDVWALVVSAVAAGIARFIGSFYVSSYRPRISFRVKEIVELFHYGKWVFSYTLVAFLGVKLGDIFVVKMLGISTLGLYQMAILIAMVFKDNVADVFCRLIFPLLSRVQGNHRELAESFVWSLEVSCLVFIPACVGLALVADPFVRVAFNQEWYPMAQVLMWLALVGGIQTINKIVNQVFKAVGKPKFIFYMGSFEVTVLSVLVYPCIDSFGLEGVAIAMLAASALRFVLTLKLVNSHIGIAGARVCMVFVPACVSTLLMALVVIGLQNELQHPGEQLVYGILVGATIFIATQVTLEKVGYGSLKHLQFLKSAYNRYAGPES